MDERVTRTRSAVIDAAIELLVAGGPTAVTVDAIVARSGVAKSTIYRHWESRDDILTDVVEAVAPRAPVIDPSEPFEATLRQFVREVISIFNDPQRARVIPAIMLLKTTEPAIDEINNRLERERADTVTVLLRRGQDEGQLDADLEPSEAIAALIGPVLFAHLGDSITLDSAFADRLVDRFLRAYARRP